MDWREHPCAMAECDHFEHHKKARLGEFEEVMFCHLFRQPIEGDELPEFCQAGARVG